MQRFGTFELLDEIGRGSMGVVYRARDLTDPEGRIVALKIMRTDRETLRAEIGHRFLREKYIAGLVDHPHIVRVHSSGIHEGRHFLVMAFAGGGPLDQHMDRFGADPRATALLVEHLARAVQHAHERGIIHRDLKPSNILLDDQGQPLLSDFGVAKCSPDPTGFETSTGRQQPGTTEYASPEQIGNRTQEIAPTTDVWTLGVVLYELLTGRHPFTGKNYIELVNNIEQASPVPPRRLCATLDPRLETICLKCLEREPHERYLTAAGLADDLQRWLMGGPVAARPISVSRHLKRHLRNHPTRWTVIGLCAVFATSMLIVAGWPRHQPADMPIERLQPIEQTLAEGRQVELIGGTGLPKWYRWRAGRTKQLEANPCTLSSLPPSLLELLPGINRDRYRLCVQMRAENYGKGESGLFFAHSEMAVADGPEHYFLTFCYDQFGRIALRAHRYREVDVNRAEIGHKATAWSLQTRVTSKEPDWCDLEVEVAPDKVRMFWAKQVAGEVSASDLGMLFRRLALLAPSTSGAALNFSPRGGLGIYVIRGSGSFRHATVEPRP